MGQYLNNFLNIVPQAAHVSFLDEGTFDNLAMPTQRGNQRRAGVDLNKVRMRRVVAAVIARVPSQPVLPSAIMRAKCAKSPDRNCNRTTCAVRPTIRQRSAANALWND